MYPQTLLVIWGIAARPFLPAGQGGLILIAGGLAMTGMAMLLLMARQRPVPAYPPGHATLNASTLVQHNPRGRSATLARAVHAKQETEETATVRTYGDPPTHETARPGNDERLVWPAYVRSAAAKAGLHNTQILSVDRTRCIIEVRHCRSCRRGRKACQSEEKRLRKAARKLSRRARVREVSCNQQGRHTCTFHIDMGATR